MQIISWVPTELKDQISFHFIGKLFKLARVIKVIRKNFSSTAPLYGMECFIKFVENRGTTVLLFPLRLYGLSLNSESIRVCCNRQCYKRISEDLIYTFHCCFYLILSS